MRRAASSILVGLAVLFGFSAGIIWSAEVVNQRAEGVTTPISTRMSTVSREVTVGRSVSLQGTAERAVAGEYTIDVAGRVTQLGDTSSLLEEGSVLVYVDLKPVVAGAGRIPGFRDLSTGSVGDDVSQLQSFLARQGLYSEPIDGSFGGGTRRAVEAWERAVGLTIDGVVSRGDIVWIPDLPRPVAHSELAVGDRVEETTVILTTLEATPRFAVRLAEQANILPDTPQIQVVLDGRARQAKLGGVVIANDQEVRELVGIDGDPLCAAPCTEVPMAMLTPIEVVVSAVPELTGVGVPLASVKSDANGATYVDLVSGGRQSVYVVGASEGVAVIEGLAEGVEVWLP